MHVDIIIPIYNAYQYTVDCIESVIRNTNLEDNTLILINDRSTDERIATFLDELAEKKLGNIRVMHNEVNLGFIGTVNRGMSLTNNDIILLNSDTEVTPNWLEKMKKAAYLNRGVGTVTSLTNNGTICSVPNFCEDNELPKEISLDEYAHIIEQTSLRLYPDIPTAVGFCMYIKREVINKIGLFDQETFGKGYGEENDFCCRALEVGYTHVLCDDTFIYHKGSTSFLNDKEKYINKNLRLLNERYPYYDSMIQKFIMANPLKSIHENIKLQLLIRNNKKNVLFVLHNDFLEGKNHPVGGTEFHVKDIIEHVENVNPIVTYVRKQEIVVQVFVEDEVIELTFPIGSMIYDFTTNSYSYKRKMEYVIDYFNIECIHIHHFKTHTMDLVDIAEERSIPLFITLHDFYCICPKIKLLNKDNVYCIESRNKEVCHECLRHAFGYNSLQLEQWNEKMYKALSSAKKVYTPSHSAKNIIEQYYQEALGNFNVEIEVVEHGIDPKNILKKAQENKTFKVAFIGGICPEKGSALIREIICADKKKDFEWHIFGNIGDQSLNLLDKEHLIKHGRYERTEIEDKLNEEAIDLICILSIWPETYSYTISEAIMAQIPILTLDIGALGERINKYKCGWVLPCNATSNEILNEIHRIKNSPEGYEIKMQNIKANTLPTKSKVGQIYAKAYNEVERRDLKSDYFINQELLKTYSIYQATKSIHGDIESNIEALVSLKKENEELKKHISIVEGTLGWKMLNYIRDRFPNVNQLGKKIIYYGAKYIKR